MTTSPAMTDKPTSPPIARPLDAAGTAIVVLLCLSWGFNQVAAKLAMPEIPPLIQAAVRSAGAAVLVALWCRIRGIRLFEHDGTLVPGLAAGALFGLEFLLIFPGLLFTTAIRSTLFIYLAPFFVVIGARYVLPGDRFTALQWAGLALSFSGMLLAFGVPTPALDPRQALGDLMMIAAAASWAATTLIIKASRLNRVSPEKTMLYQLVVSVPMLAAGAWLLGERVTAWPSGLALGLLAWQTVWVVSITFVLWFAMIVRYSASRVSAFTFLTPLFGVAAGHLVLNEPINWAFAGAVVLVIAGLVVVNRPR